MAKQQTEKMNANRARFQELMEQAAGKRHGYRAFMEWLEETDFYEAPASTKYHGNVPGGLLQHSLNVHNRMWLSGNAREYIQKGGKECSVTVASLLHDICKVDTYRKTDNGYEYRNDIFLPVGHGERSIMLVQQYMTLTQEEVVAIRWHMGAFDKAAQGGSRELSEAFRRFPLAPILHVADMEATYLDE